MSDPNTTPGRPADRFSAEHVEDLIVHAEGLAKRRRTRAMLMRVVGVMRGAARAVGSMLEWWPKVWKAATGIAALMLVAEGAGYPVLQNFGDTIRGIVTALAAL